MHCNESVMFMECEAVVTMDHDGSTAGIDDDGEQLDVRQVAWLLREKLNELFDDDQGKSPELELGFLLNMVASRKIISMDPKMLNCVLQRTLLTELLLFVLARLPLPDITRLHCLSNKWKRDMATVNLEINRACDGACSNMVALVFSARMQMILEMTSL